MFRFDLAPERQAPAPASSKNPGSAYPALKSRRYQSMDIWRGVACLMVVILHSALWTKVDDAAVQHVTHPIASIVLSLIDRMGVGLPIFFAISGYCIAATADSTRRKSHSIGLDYFKRRIRRIFPPYWVVIILTLILCAVLSWAGHPNILALNPTVGMVPDPASITPLQWLGNITLTENWRYHLINPDQNKLIGVAWTLCYEEQFYVVCGLILFLAPRRFFTGIFAVTVVVVILKTLVGIHPTQATDGFFFDGQWLIFAAGVFAYYGVNYRGARFAKWVPLGLGLSVASLAVIRYVVLRHSTDAGLKDDVYNIQNGIAFALLAVILHPFDKAMISSRILAPVAWCGRMCYSLYLMHWPITILVGQVLLLHGVHGYVGVLLITVPITCTISIAAAAVFHHLVERYFLNKSSSPAPSIERVPAGFAPNLA
jgi:peptidoglycan/LPS O-acetylase OafA/YrhL